MAAAAALCALPASPAWFLSGVLACRAPWLVYATGKGAVVVCRLEQHDGEYEDGAPHLAQEHAEEEHAEEEHAEDRKVEQKAEAEEPSPRVCFAVTLRVPGSSSGGGGGRGGARNRGGKGGGGAGSTTNRVVGVALPMAAANNTPQVLVALTQDGRAAVWRNDEGDAATAWKLRATGERLHRDTRKDEDVPATSLACYFVGSSEAATVMCVSGDQRGRVLLWSVVPPSASADDPLMSSPSSPTPLVDEVFRSAVTCLHAFQRAPGNESDVLVAIGLQSGGIHLVSTEQRAVVMRLEGHMLAVQSLSALHNSDWLLSTSKEADAKLWRVSQPKPVATVHMSGVQQQQQHNAGGGGGSKAGRRAENDSRQWAAGLLLDLHSVDAAVSEEDDTKEGHDQDPMVRLRFLASSPRGDLSLFTVTTSATAEAGKGRSNPPQTHRTRLAKPVSHSRPVFGLAPVHMSTAQRQRRLVASISMDRQIILWNPAQSSAVSALATLGGYPYQLCENAERVAVACGDNSVHLWNPLASTVQNHRLLWKGVQDRVTAVAWHPTDVNRLAFGERGGRVCIADMQGGGGAGTVRVLQPLQHEVRRILRLDDAPSLLLVLLDNGHVHLLFENGTAQDLTPSLMGIARSVGMLTSGDRPDEDEVSAIACHARRRRRPDRSSAAEAPKEQDTAGGEPKNPPPSMCLLAVAFSSGVVCLIDWAPPCQDNERSTTAAAGERQEATGPTDDGEGEIDGVFRLLWSRKDHSGRVCALDFCIERPITPPIDHQDELGDDHDDDDDGVTLVCGGDDGLVVVSSSASSLARYSHRDRVTDAAFSRRCGAAAVSGSATHIAGTGGEGEDSLLNATEGKYKHTDSALLLATSSCDRTVQVWNLTTNTPVGNFRHHSGPVRCVLWSRREPEALFSGGEDDTVVLLHPLQDWTPSRLPPSRTSGKKGAKKKRELTTATALPSKNPTTTPATSARDPAHQDADSPATGTAPPPVAQTMAIGTGRRKVPGRWLPLGSGQMESETIASQHILRLARLHREEHARESVLAIRREAVRSLPADSSLMFGPTVAQEQMRACREEHISNDRTEQAARVALLEGDVRAAIELVMNDPSGHSLTEHWVAVSAALGRDVWRRVAYAFAMKCLRKGELSNALSFLLATGHVPRAVDECLRSAWYAEAVALIHAWQHALLPSKSTTDMDSDSTSPSGLLFRAFFEWATAMERGGHHGQAARLFLAAGAIDRAIPAATRSTKAYGLAAALILGSSQHITQELDQLALWKALLAARLAVSGALNRWVEMMALAAAGAATSEPKTDEEDDEDDDWHACNVLLGPTTPPSLRSSAPLRTLVRIVDVAGLLVAALAVADKQDTEEHAPALEEKQSGLGGSAKNRRHSMCARLRDALRKRIARLEPMDNKGAACCWPWNAWAVSAAQQEEHECGDPVPWMQEIVARGIVPARLVAGAAAFDASMCESQGVPQQQRFYVAWRNQCAVLRVSTTAPGLHEDAERMHLHLEAIACLVACAPASLSSASAGEEGTFPPPTVEHLMSTMMKRDVETDNQDSVQIGEDEI